MSSADNRKINSVYWALRITFGLVPLLAGLDKFFNLLTQWEKYLSPLALKALPFSGTTFMHIVGVIEIAAGIIVLAGFTRLGGYIVTLWLIGIALNLVAAGYYDIAVRDLAMSVAAFSLARLSEVLAEHTASAASGAREALA